jgi:2-polyprenyl-3-methyl-5-hydroxy-6-metoxy-1,4-benzoquinol methylase
VQKNSITGQASIKNKWTCWRAIYPYTWAIWQQSSYRHFANYINALENSTILDLGTGIGSYIHLLKLKPGTRIIFTDPEPVALAQAQSIPSESSIQFSFDVMDANSAIKKYSSVTHVSMLHVYSVLPDAVGLLEQCHRQTPNALLMIYLSKFNGISWLNFLSTLFGFSQIDSTLLKTKFSMHAVGRNNLVFQGYP